MVLPTNRLGLTYIEEGGQGGESIFNDLLNIADCGFFGLTAIDRDLNDSPAFPSATGLTITIDAGARTITRSAGSWITDNFEVSQVIQITDSDFNDGFYTIIEVTSATVLTVEEAFIDDETSTASVDVAAVIWTQGKIYIVGTSATGAWSGEDNSIAIYASGWKFFAPHIGWLVYLEDEDLYVYWTGSAWATALNP